MNVLINTVSGEPVSALEGILIALLGYLVVYIGLTLLMLVVYTLGKVFLAKGRQESVAIKENAALDKATDTGDDEEAAIVAMMAATVLLNQDAFE